MSITYIKGDASCPQAKGVKIIAHVCNDRRKWGKGFVMAISKRWDEPRAAYLAWESFALGDVQFVQVEPYIWVANMIAQHGIKEGSSGPPIRYDAVSACLKNLGEKSRELRASVHMPRIGCGLAGGGWSRIEPLIQEHLNDVAVTIYDFE